MIAFARAFFARHSSASWAAEEGVAEIVGAGEGFFVFFGILKLSQMEQYINRLIMAMTNP